jgi:inner membrane protein
MDSLTQFVLGSAVGVAVMGRRTAAWKAALWGGLCGTLPDLDAFVDHGDPVANMTLHRADSHALFWLTLAAPPIAALAAWASRESASFARWWLAVWLALVTHPLLDLMTVYGTQLGRPFTDHPYALGSIFIIDPLYTLPSA